MKNLEETQTVAIPQAASLPVARSRSNDVMLDMCSVAIPQAGFLPVGHDHSTISTSFTNCCNPSSGLSASRTTNVFSATLQGVKLQSLKRAFCQSDAEQGC